MLRLAILFFLIVLFLLIKSIHGINANKFLLEPLEICKKMKRTPKKLLEICTDKVDKNNNHNNGSEKIQNELLKKISIGINLGFKECENQFRNQRWNCTNNKRLIRKTLLRDTKETAFIHAITAAGITYSLAVACSMGDLVECFCENNVMIRDEIYLENSMKIHKKKGRKNRKLKNSTSLKSTTTTTTTSNSRNFEWSGCDNFVNFGNRKSRNFLDFSRPNDVKTSIKIHNNNAGRAIIKRLLRPDCKCHGLSGSCSMKTCWMKLPPFTEIGSRLRDKYDVASKVTASNDGASFMTEDYEKPPTKRSLLYIEESPNFCKQNLKIGILGVKGRECEISSKNEDGCEQMCCDGYSRIKTFVRRNCNCKFIWCCEVVCNICDEMREIGICD